MYMFQGVTYATRKAVQDRLNTTIKAMPLGEPLTGADLTTAMEITALLPARDEVRRGIRRIEVERREQKRELWVTAADGTKFKVRLHLAFSAPPSDRSSVNSALRTAISDQVRDFRREYFESTDDPICAISGEPLYNDSSTHIDHHHPTFVELATQFVAGEGGLTAIHFQRVSGGDTFQLKDRAQTERWKSMHRRRANLRAVTDQANLRRPRNPANEVPTEPAPVIGLCTDVEELVAVRRVGRHAAAPDPDTFSPAETAPPITSAQRAEEIKALVRAFIRGELTHPPRHPAYAAF